MSSPTKLAIIRDEMKRQFLERSDLIDASIAALAAQKHVLVVGPPGTAKSLLAEEITRRIDGARVFKRLVNKFSTPEELLGPWRMSALKDDRYARNFINYMPDAEIVFLDEIYKANSAVLNSVLRIINERKFEDDGASLDVPLQTLFAASNELPEGEELGALHDRLLVRLVVDYVQEKSSFMKLITDTFNTVTNPTTISMVELQELQAQVADVKLPEPIARDISKLKDDLHKEGIIPGDRRWHDAMAVLRGNAVVEGRTAIAEDDVSLLRHMLWILPQNIKPVHRAVLAISSPNEREALDILDQVEEIRTGIGALQGQVGDKNATSPQSKQGLEYHTKLGKLKVKLTNLRKDATEAGRSCTEVDRALARTESAIQTVLTDVLGLELGDDNPKA